MKRFPYSAEKKGDAFGQHLHHLYEVQGFSFSLELFIEEIWAKEPQQRENQDLH